MDGQANKTRTRKRTPKRPTPDQLMKTMIKFGENYRIDGEQDFLEAARIYSEEAGLIQQMRDILADEGLTVTRTMKGGGECPAVHPLLAELPRHIESANKCLATIGDMILKRGTKTEHAPRELDAFRL